MATRRQTGKFPLHIHASGQWAKKIRSKRFYFGTDKDAALAEYVRVRADLEGGRLPRPKQDGGVTVAEVGNAFLSAKRQQVDAGELSLRQWQEYFATVKRLTDQFGRGRVVSDLRPEDFAAIRAEAAERLGVFALSKFIQMVRSVFKYANDHDLIEKPIKYASSFDKPKRRSARLARAAKGSMMLDATDVLKLLQHADASLKAMILLGLNCGYGNGDCSALDRSMLTERPGWINFPRPKTGIARRSPLWPETIEALTNVRTIRPRPVDEADSDAVFLTRQGHRYVRFTESEKASGVRRDSVRDALLRTAKRACVELPGGFYTLRHVHRTVADGAKDQAAANALMGHADDSLAAIYREGIDDARLVVVTDHVRAWLFPAGTVSHEKRD